MLYFSERRPFVALDFEEDVFYQKWIQAKPILILEGHLMIFPHRNCFIKLQGQVSELGIDFTFARNNKNNNKNHH